LPFFLTHQYSELSFSSYNFVNGLNEVHAAVAAGGIEAGTLIRSTRSGAVDLERFRFTVSSSDGAAYGFPHLIRNPEFSDPDLISRYPLKLLTPPATDLLNSTFGTSPPKHRPSAGPPRRRGPIPHIQ
jgi:hypothetical protein